MIPIARGAAQPGQKPIKETDAGDSSKPECWEPRSLGLYTEQNHIVVQQGVYDSVVRGGIYNTLKYEHLLHLIDKHDRVPRGPLIMKNRWLSVVEEYSWARVCPPRSTEQYSWARVCPPRSTEHS